MADLYKQRPLSKLYLLLLELPVSGLVGDLHAIEAQVANPAYLVPTDHQPNVITIDLDLLIRYVLPADLPVLSDCLCVLVFA